MLMGPLGRMLDMSRRERRGMTLVLVVVGLLLALTALCGQCVPDERWPQAVGDGAGRSAAAVEAPADTVRRHDTVRRPGDGRGKPPRKGRRHSVPARDGKKPRPLRPPLDPLPRF